MKKLIALLLMVLTMCLQLCACNSTGNQPDADTEAKNTESTDETSVEEIMGSDNGGKFVFVKNDIIFEYSLEAAVGWETKYGYEFEYGEDGRIVKGRNNNNNEWYEYEYFPNGNVSKRIRGGYDENDNKVVGDTTTFEYDNKNNLVKSTTVYTNSGCSTDEYVYDETGKLILWKMMGAADVETKLEYDENGKMTGLNHFYNHNGTLELELSVEYIYNDTGFLVEKIRRSRWDAEKRVIYEYDTDGNKTKSAIYYNNIISEEIYYYPSGEVKVSISYDAEGLKDYQSSYYENGELKEFIGYYEDGTESGHYYYDENGTIKNYIEYYEDGSVYTKYGAVKE